MGDPYRALATVPAIPIETFEPNGALMSRWELGSVKLEWDHRQGCLRLFVADRGGWLKADLREEEARELMFMLQKALAETETP